MDKVKVGVLGCGGIARGHVQRLRAMEEAEIVALCDVNDEITAAFKQACFGEDGDGLACYTDAAAMYAGSAPDAVVIATPHTLHFEQGVQALEAGCHVFMEKPMVTSASHAHELAAKVEETGKVFTIGYCTPCTPAFGYLRDKIRAKAFGNLELVNGFLCQNWLNITRGKWRQVPALSGGGQAYDSGAHILNSLVWSVEDRVAEVFAFVDNHGAPVDINSALVVRFENNVLASLCIGGNCAKAGQHMSFMFENGRIDIDGWGGTWIKVFADGEPEVPEFGEVDGSPTRNFIDAVLGRCEPKTSPLNGVYHSELMDAIYESAAAGRPAKPGCDA